MDGLHPLSSKPSHLAPWLSDVLCSNQRELIAPERKWMKSLLDTDLWSEFSSDVTSAKTSFYKGKLEASAPDPCSTDVPQDLFVTSCCLALHPPSWLLVTFFDFKAAHFTETATAAITEELHAPKSAKMSSCLIFLDFSAASNTGSRKTILSIFIILGISDTALQWFASYLQGHSLFRLSKGVPQGLVVGSLPFSLYTHSHVESISSHGFPYHCYAADTHFILSFSPTDSHVSA